MTAEEATFNASFDLLDAAACLQCGAVVPNDYRRMHLDYHAFLTELDRTIDAMFTLIKTVEGRLSLFEPGK